jgi:hypothetical protein
LRIWRYANPHPLDLEKLSGTQQVRRSSRCTLQAPAPSEPV